MDAKLLIQKLSIIHAKPAVKFEILTDVENWNKWTPSVKKSTLLGGTSFAVGAKVRVVQPELLPVIWNITEIEKNNSFTWVSTSIGLKVIARHIIEEDSDFSTVRLVTIYQGFLSKIIYNLTCALTDKYMMLEANGLKQACEAKPSFSL